MWCADEAGPYQAIPQPGVSWQPMGQPARYPHEYLRGGTAKLLTLFHPATGQVHLAGHKSAVFVCWLMTYGIMPLYTPLSGSWLNMAESIQRILVDRALAGQHPESPAQLIGSPLRSSDVSRCDRQSFVIVMNKIPNSPDVIFYNF